MSDFNGFKNLIGEKVGFVVTTNQVSSANINPKCYSGLPSSGLPLKGNTVVFNDIFDKEKVKHNQTIVEILRIEVFDLTYNFDFTYNIESVVPIFILSNVEFNDCFGDFLNVFILDLSLYNKKLKVIIQFTQNDSLNGSFSPKIATAYTKNNEIVLSNKEKSFILDFCYMHRDIMNYSRELTRKKKEDHKIK